MSEILTIFVPGSKPKPKGSLRHVGRGRMVEQVTGSKDWRTAVVAACMAQVINNETGLLARILKPGYPSVAEVECELTFWFERPKSRPTGGPCTGSTGDLDKLMRNIGDALQDAGVIKNDAQITRAVIAKEYAGDEELTGVSIVVRERYPELAAAARLPKQRRGSSTPAKVES